MTKKTLRLTFPQWQGGINPPYYEGSHILDWLAPKMILWSVRKSRSRQILTTRYR